jgi:hypothetical protein
MTKLTNRVLMLQPKAAGFVALFVAAGTVLIVAYAGSGFFVVLSPQQGVIQGNAGIVSNASAVDGSAVKFGLQTPAPPTPTPSPNPGSSPSPSPTGASGCSANGVVAPCVGGPTTGAAGWGTPAFDEEFSGSALNTSVWDAHDGWTNQNNVTDHASNVSVTGGEAILTLVSSGSGAAIETKSYALPVGGFAEARVEFPGSGTTIYNWPAWWISGPNWPTDGESDIAEGLGTLTVNYHSPSGAHNQGTVPGTWSNAYHIYGISRGPSSCKVYWDGTLVKTYSTDDTGKGENLILTAGSGNTGAYGTASEVKVDYVRAWN